MREPKTDGLEYTVAEIMRDTMISFLLYQNLEGTRQIPEKSAVRCWMVTSAGSCPLEAIDRLAPICADRVYFSFFKSVVISHQTLAFEGTQSYSLLKYALKNTKTQRSTIIPKIAPNFI